MNYDIIVVGAGHAGCEAALASAKIGKKTILITSNINNVATLPCNPSIGGSAKGIIVREIDALGGIMGKVADISHFQIKMLNNAKQILVSELVLAEKSSYEEMENIVDNKINQSFKEFRLDDESPLTNMVNKFIPFNEEN